MNFTLFLLGREVVSIQLELPTIPAVTDIASLFVPESLELVEYEEEEPEDRSSTVRLGFQQCSTSSRSA